MEGVTKRGERVMTDAGAIVGLLVGYFVFQKVIGGRMIEIGRFTLAVFAGGLAGMAVYVLVKDGVALLLRRAAASSAARGGPSAPAPATAAKPPVALDDPNDDDYDESDEDAFKPVKTATKKKATARRAPLRATVAPEPDDDEAPRKRAAKKSTAKAQKRPLRPRD
jgi:hypothetical protein